MDYESAQRCGYARCSVVRSPLLGGRSSGASRGLTQRRNSLSASNGSLKGICGDVSRVQPMTLHATGQGSDRPSGPSAPMALGWTIRRLGMRPSTHAQRSRPRRAGGAEIRRQLKSLSHEDLKPRSGCRGARGEGKLGLREQTVGSFAGHRCSCSLQAGPELRDAGREPRSKPRSLRASAASGSGRRLQGHVRGRFSACVRQANAAWALRSGSLPREGLADALAVSFGSSAHKLAADPCKKKKVIF